MNSISWLLSLALFSSLGHASDRGLSENPDSLNSALLVSSAHGLPGLDFDMNNVDLMVSNKASGFSVSKLESGKSDAQSMLNELSRVAESVDSRGTMLFYFTGHGGDKIILADDRTVSLDEIKAALAKGRENWGPMVRLTFLLDSCHSGSMIDPLKTASLLSPLEFPKAAAAELADAVLKTFAPQRGESPLYHSLFAFVSARADETCSAGDNGSDFTVAMRAAWDQAASRQSTIAQFIRDTQKGTKGSHPVSRLVPLSLSQEKMISN